MENKARKKISRFLSLVLRHKPEVLGLQLDDNGWVSVEELLEKMNQPPHHLSMEDLKEVVETNDKQRFIFSEDFQMIRANQGHSVQVDLDLEEKIPPGILYHGTAVKNLDSIHRLGLLKGERHHVHLSSDRKTAIKVGSRHGKPVVLPIKALQMYQSGIKFYLSENGVWLTDQVAPHFIDFSDEQ